MNKLNKVQKDKVRQFTVFANSSEKIALDALKRSEWNLEQAIDDYFNNSSSVVRTSQAPPLDRRKIEELFARYKEKDSDAIGIEGTERFCSDLGVDPTDVVMLIISWKFQAATMCEFSHQEFVNGLLAVGCDSIERLRDKLPRLRSEMQDEPKFQDLYMYSFNFAKEPTQKSLALDTAIAMWQLILKDHFRFLDMWCDFLQENHKKAISKDTWSLLYQFSKQHNGDLTDYDAEGAWPVVIDDFVEYARSKKQNTKASA